MSELKCVLSAMLYVLAQLVVIVLKPLVLVLDQCAKKCAAVASTELAKLKPAEMKVPEA